MCNASCVTYISSVEPKINKHNLTIRYPCRNCWLPGGSEAQETSLAVRAALLADKCLTMIPNAQTEPAANADLTVPLKNLQTQTCLLAKYWCAKSANGCPELTNGNASRVPLPITLANCVNQVKCTIKCLAGVNLNRPSKFWDTVKKTELTSL